MPLLERIGAAWDAVTAPAAPAGLGLQALAPQESTLANPEPWLRSALGPGPTASGKAVTPESAMRVSAVYGCVSVLAQGVAQLPFVMYRKTSEGAERATDHPLYSLLLNAFNPETTSQDAREMEMNHLCLRGNAYCQIVRSGGYPRELNPLHPDWVRMDRDASGNLVYDYSPPRGGGVVFSSTEIWRIIGKSFNGIQGVTPITYAREAIGLAMAVEEQGARLFVNGAQGGIAVEVPTVLSDAAYARLRTSFDERFGGSRNAWKTLILEEGLKVSKLAMTPEESQFIQTRRFQLEDICRFYGVPPHKVQDTSRATFNNIEHLSMDFKNTSLAPWMSRFEATAWRDLLLPREQNQYFFRHDTSQLDRADTAALANLIASGRANTWLSANEGRAMFNLNAIPGGNTYENPNTSGATKPNQALPDPTKG